ncbi:MAG: bifunctional isocitrate dehydrogenase kinase/phosphatase [Pirellulaceae bacterium]|nr:bifunctional isocitrate dehydrogenase kinase/phosphatase [Planctomycetales bacterium]
MIENVTTSQRAKKLAGSILESFDLFQQRYREITRRAEVRFRQRDWHGMANDATERIDIYETTVKELVTWAKQVLGSRIGSHLAWVSTKAVYSGLIEERDDWEIAETFFNSVTRCIFDTVGVDEEIEFVHTDFEHPPTVPERPAYRSYDLSAGLVATIAAILRDSRLFPDDAAIDDPSRATASVVERQFAVASNAITVTSIEMISRVFYRGDMAFLIGRIPQDRDALPLVFCIQHDDHGVSIDAVLTDEDDVSALFSYARSSFHVDTGRPYGIVRFVKSILPRKPTAEIYISLGYHKHGKTEMYRHALRHLAQATDQYQLAPGQRGMVMIVFTMPSYPVVFKIIKDEFDYPKTTTRQAVMDSYRLVFKHDRAGRLIDAQQYRYLTLDRRRFDDDLISELLETASQTVSVENDRVVIKHCYAERRVTPLNVYLQEADEQAARAIVEDYGQAIKEMALTNIFPGDLLLKNFGVTRQGRLVYYDYDEVCLLTDCRFRMLPVTDDYDEQIAAEPWFAVDKYDVFPEEFQYFLGFPPPLKEVFMEHHADLLTVDYWCNIQQRLRDGEMFHFAPYGEQKRLNRESVSDLPASVTRRVVNTADFSTTGSVTTTNSNRS